MLIVFNVNTIPCSFLRFCPNIAIKFASSKITKYIAYQFFSKRTCWMFIENLQKILATIGWMVKSTSHRATLFTNLKLRHTPRVYFRFGSATSCLSFSKQTSYLLFIFRRLHIFLYLFQLLVKLCARECFITTETKLPFYYRFCEKLTKRRWLTTQRKRKWNSNIVR
jgi:hypothetical protein